MVFETNSAEDTQKLGEEFAKKLNGNEFVALYGEAGAGKTVFCKGIAKGLGINETVTSPTFCIIKEYSGKFRLFHYDMYRIKDSAECAETDFFENLSKGVNVAEWSENIAEIIPHDAIKIHFSYIGENKRKIIFENFSI